MSIIQIENLTKSFGQFKALEDVNLEVKQGEIHGFIGPNGAGKSTTIRVLLGMLKADTGNITIFGKDTWQEAVSIHSRIAYVPGDANLWPNLTGGQIIDLFLNMRNSTIDNKRRDELIKYFELDPTKNAVLIQKEIYKKFLLYLL